MTTAKAKRRVASEADGFDGQATTAAMAESASDGADGSRSQFFPDPCRRPGG
jgi:hypothetical protein